MSTSGKLFTIQQIKHCLDCEVFLRTHLTLRVPRVTEMAKRKHVTRAGKQLHRAMIAGEGCAGVGKADSEGVSNAGNGGSTMNQEYCMVPRNTVEQLAEYLDQTQDVEYIGDPPTPRESPYPGAGEHLAALRAAISNRDNRFMRQHDCAELLDVLTLALPYIEFAESDESYTPGAVRKVTQRIKAVIKKAEVAI